MLICSGLTLSLYCLLYTSDIEGVASTSSDLLPYGKFRIVESEAPNGYLTDGAKPIDFTITENGKIVDLTDKAHSIYNQIKRGDIEGVKIGAGSHKRLADVPFRITSKTTGENHVVVTDDNGQFSTSAEWASHKHNTNAGKTSEDGIWSVSYTHLDVYKRQLYLLDEEEIPVLRSCPYASVFSDSRMYYPYLQEGTKLVSAAVTNHIWPA